jgi:hypothetical protein
VVVRRFPERSRDALLVFVVALIVRMAFVAWAHGRFPPSDDAHFYEVLARRLASGAGYTWIWPDGTVTYAAHYPVGYPAILGLAYRVFGATAAVAMTLNAVFGAAGAFATHRLVDSDAVARWRPLAAGLAVAVHPALVPYTGALMTEGVTGSLLVVAAAIASHARDDVRSGGGTWPSIIGAGLVAGVATLVRPQSLLIAPVLGAIAARPGAGTRVRLSRAGAVTAVALLCVAPWTARNCVRMHRCAVVSVNGGWNLLIGTQTSGGGWEPVSVPAECATVWDEAAKDSCFERVARRRIVAQTGDWLSRVPAKLAASFDYMGAAPWYLHASNASAFGERAKETLGAVETAMCRLLLLAALVAVGRLPGPRSGARKMVALAGAVAAITVHAWIGYLAIPACAALMGGRAAVRAPPTVAVTAAVVAATAAVHAVIFGAGRYGLVVVPFVTALAFVSGEVRHEVSEAIGTSHAYRLRRAPPRGTVRPSTPLGRSPVVSARFPQGRLPPREESPSSTEHDAG